MEQWTFEHRFAGTSADWLASIMRGTQDEALQGARDWMWVNAINGQIVEVRLKVIKHG